MPNKLNKSVKKNILAIVEISGHQHLVGLDQELKLDRQSLPVGEKFESNRVLLLSKEGGLKIGQPHIAGAKITFEVLADFKGPKIEVMKYKAKSRYRKHIGYRSHLTKVKVVDIS